MNKYLLPFAVVVTTSLIILSCEETPAFIEDVEEIDDSTSVDLSGNVPTQVVFPGGPSTNDTLNRPAFDEFSWKMFIALCWPAQEGERGVPMNPDDPNTFLQMSNTTPVVWTSYKNQWDLFNQGNNVPSKWDDPTDPINVCGNSTATSHDFLSTMAGELNESFSVPLVDQNKNYVYFEIRYNKVQYDFVRDNGLYDNKKLYDYQQAHDGQLQMPISTDTKEGSIMVKAAWKVLEESEDDSRYYVINEQVYDPVVDSCHKMKLGLIGFHIAQKVEGFSQWVWASFEQVDNVPGSKGGKSPYNLNNGTADPSTGTVGFANKPGTNIIQDKNKRTPVQVNRVNPIPTTPADSSTVDINAKYQQMVKGTWMEYYELVITQWPTDDASFKLPPGSPRPVSYPQDCGAAFPTANCVNTTMETYFQTLDLAAPAAPFALNGGNSCMGCHYGSAQTDFSFSLKLRTHNVQNNTKK